MIEAIVPVLPDLANAPPSLYSERAILLCGCAVYIGVRIDTDPPEIVSRSGAVAEEHNSIMERYHELMIESLEHRSDRLLVEVCDELLLKAHAEAGC